MAGKQGKSPKLNRSTRHPKKGAVRSHRSKGVEITRDTGLLDELAQRSRSRDQVSSSNPGQRSVVQENQDEVTQLLLWQLGTKVTAMAKAQAWQSGALAPTCDYVKSLVTGNGSKPVELGSLCAAPIERIFAQLCAKLIVGNDVLPGQQQDWYQPTLAKVKGPSAKNPWVHMPSAPSHLTLVMAS